METILTAWSDNARHNNHVMARIARAAYAREPAARKIIERELEIYYGTSTEIHWWEHRNAHGVIVLSEHDGSVDMLCGIAGTDAIADWIFTNANVSRLHLNGSWAEANGLQLADDVGKSDLCSLAGFAGYASNCAEGIAEVLSESGISIGACRHVGLAGHSLGGAACYLLQFIEPWPDAEAWTYSAPRTFFGGGGCRIPSRVRSASRRLCDPVVYLPPSCVRTPAADIYVSRSGIRTTWPRGYAPALAFAVLLAWIVFGVTFVLRLCGCPVPKWLSVSRAHGIDAMVEMLK